MNLQQLRIVRETARRQFNLTDVANALYTSQSGVSKHLKDLEEELGVELFERKGKRLLGLTAPGAQLLGMAERILLEAENMKRLARQYVQQDEGRLAIATTHTQARYALPRIIKAFKLEFPKVHLELHQCGPDEIVSLLKAGQVDIGIATEALPNEGNAFVCFPFYSWQHSVVVPREHPLTRLSQPTLADLADYPVITYHDGYTGRTRIDAVFADAGLTPDVVMSAVDADVIKTYVELGMGIGIIASMAYTAERDTLLQRLPVESLFSLNTTQIALRRGHFLRQYAYRFLNYCSDELDQDSVQQALASAEPGQRG